MAGPLPDIQRLLTYENTGIRVDGSGYKAPIMWDFFSQGAMVNIDIKGWFTSLANPSQADWDHYMKLYLDVFFFGFDPDHPMMAEMPYEASAIDTLISQRTPTILNRANWRDIASLVGSGLGGANYGKDPNLDSDDSDANLPPQHAPGEFNTNQLNRNLVRFFTGFAGFTGATDAVGAAGTLVEHWLHKLEGITERFLLSGQTFNDPRIWSHATTMSLAAGNALRVAEDKMRFHATFSHNVGLFKAPRNGLLVYYLTVPPEMVQSDDYSRLCPDNREWTSLEWQVPRTDLMDGTVDRRTILSESDLMRVMETRIVKDGGASNDHITAGTLARRLQKNYPFSTSMEFTHRFMIDPTAPPSLLKTIR